MMTVLSTLFRTCEPSCLCLGPSAARKRFKPVQRSCPLIWKVYGCWCRALAPKIPSFLAFGALSPADPSASPILVAIIPIIPMKHISEPVPANQEILGSILFRSLCILDSAWRPAWPVCSSSWYLLVMSRFTLNAEFCWGCGQKRGTTTKGRSRFLSVGNAARCWN